MRPVSRSDCEGWRDARGCNNTPKGKRTGGVARPYTVQRCNYCLSWGDALSITFLTVTG